MQNIRKFGFWFIDALKGGPVRSYYKDIKDILENFHSSGAKEKREEYLKNILNHAKQTVPYYKNITSGKLSDFPVVNKNIIKNNFEDFKSEKFNGEEVSPVTTSGSTGTPFTVLQDISKRNRNSADTVYFAKKAGYKIGDLVVFMKIWSKINKKSPLEKWMQNMWTLDVIKLTDETIAGFLKDLKNNSSRKGFIGYASAYETICKYLEKNKSAAKDYNIHSIIAISESLNEYTKKSMKKYFSSPVVSRYSNIENGIMAQQCIEDNHEFHINSASYKIEILKLKEDKPAENGELGRIVVTDYFNYAMPLIRYDTGDIGSISSKSKCTFNTPVLKHLEGRKLDMIFDTSGRLVSSYIVYKNMWAYSEVNQYQLIQESQDSYRIKINAETKFNREEQLISEFKEFLGDDANIVVEQVNEIPLLASGKRKKVSNLMNQK